MDLLRTNIIPESDSLPSVRSLVPIAHSGSIFLFQGEYPVLTSAMQELVDRFALQESVQVIVGGNRISFDHIPLLLGEEAGSVYEILDRILVSRAESCYQMLDALTSLSLGPVPLVITDFLESFYEDDLTHKEVTLLLQNCLQRIQQLSEQAPVLISARADATRPNLISLLEQFANTRFYFQPPEQLPQPVQAAFQWVE